MNVRFRNRVDAGWQLAGELSEYKGRENVVVLALPRGGVVPGAVIARELNVPLDVIMVKKIGHPGNSEYAIGAVSMKGRVLESDAGVGKDYIEKKTKEIRDLLNVRYRKYFGDKEPVAVKDKTVIVVDDGIATGRTIKAALQLLEDERPDKIIVAVPVGPTRTIRELEPFVDKIICLGIYSDLYAIGVYYDDFSQVSDEEVKDILTDTNKVFSFD